MSQRKLERLRPEECFDLLEPGGVGRIVYVDPEGPVAVPVNFSLDMKKVVFRIEHSTKQAALHGSVAFEVDQIDPEDHSGWSVLVRGRAEELPMAEVGELLHRNRDRFPRPWAEGVHGVWMSITPTSVTGRRLGAQLSGE